MSNRDLLLGQQAHKRKELEDKIKRYKTLQVVLVKKPSWYHSEWKTLYQIVKK